MKSKWVWIVSAAMVAAGALFAVLQKPATRVSPFEDPAQPATAGVEGQEIKIAPKNAPVVTGFVGDLLLKGNPEDEGKVIQPFVVGETLKLQAEAHNAVEYRWAVNGKPLTTEKEQEWGPQPERFYDVVKPGKYVFSVQVRGADKSLVSLEKTVELDILPLKIVRVEKNIVHDDDERFLTGDEINLDVSMAQSMGADPDFYQFRYYVNDELIKTPDDDPDTQGEWTHNSSLTFAFPTPGNYTFKVEARRSTEKEVEGRMELPETVIVADAVLLSLDSFPDNEKGAAVGTQVSLSSFPVSRYGKSECRFGVKRINAADYAWISESAGTLWGESSRTWVPTEPGTYLVRCDVREIGKEAPDDFREMYFTITDGNF